jgi:diguanylate cyclase (GGDEF)-like protein
MRSISSRLQDPGFRAFFPYLTAFFLTAFIGIQALGQGTGLGNDILVLGSFFAVSAILVRQGLIVREARLLTSHLSQQVDRDPLTGLPNRRRVHERIERELMQARITGQSLGLALIDIDNFKAVNDTYGHSAGDHVLKAIAGILARACRGSDIAARYAGDEFLLVLPGLELQNAHIVGQRLLKEVGRSRRTTAPAFGVEISISVGLAVSRDCLKPARQLIAIADAAMYDAKDAGKNQLVIVDADSKVVDIEERLRGDTENLGGAIEMMSTAG